MNGNFRLWLDQYGNRFTSRTLKELRQQISGRCAKMYVDRNGRSVHVGYVIGQHWLSMYAPVEIPA